MTNFGGALSFARAAAQVYEHYGIKVSESGLRETTQRHGRAMWEEMSEVGELPLQGVPVLLGECDGSMIPVVRLAAGVGDGRQRRLVSWREVKLSLAGVPGSSQRQYGASLGGPAEAGEQWRGAVLRAGGGRNTRLHCVGDGAGWISRQVAEQFGGAGRYLVDFYHVSEYVGACGEACGGGGGVGEWLREQQERLKRNEIEEVLGELAGKVEEVGQPRAASPVRVCLEYLGSRREQLDYAGALREGLPIGSGEIESGHRTVIQERLKISGAWWSERGAEAMLGLRLCLANGRWEQYWSEQWQLRN